MNRKALFQKDILFKWLSYCLLLAFIYYWLFTMGLVFFNHATRTAAPRQSMLYTSFFNQNWRLFAITNTYSSELSFVTRQPGTNGMADTFPLVQYSIAQKKQHAPFNNYQDAMERLLFLAITDLSATAEKKRQLLMNTFPGKSTDFYTQQVTALLEKDPAQQQVISNLENYGKFILTKTGKTTAGKEFRMILFHRYILPAGYTDSAAGNRDIDTVFLSTYKPL